MGGTYLIGAQGRRYAKIGDFFVGAAVGTVSINDSGRLAYVEYAGPKWELRSSVAPNRSILRPNHFLDGRRVQSVYLSWQAISQRDEIACLVVFTDGHQAIYRASPLTSGGADFPRQPDGVLTSEPGGLLQYTFENMANGSWVELPPRGTVTITSPNAQGRITQLLGISDHLANRADVLVNAVPFVQWAASFFPGQDADDAITGPDATPLNDGVPNLVKYAFGMDPTRPLTAADHERIARVSRVIPGEETRLELRLLLHPAAVDVGLALESSPDPAAEAWTVLGAQELAVQENLGAAGRELKV